LYFSLSNKFFGLRLAIVSDIHEDTLSLKKVISKIEKAGYDQLICLGDISGFSVDFYRYKKSRNAHDCLSLLREKDFLIVPGNHDFFAARRIPEESDIFNFPSNWYNLEKSERAELAGGKIWLHEEDDLDPLYTLEDISYLNSLPEYHVLDGGDSKLLLSHYIYPNLSGFQKEFYTTASEFKAHLGFMESQDCKVSFTGHTHFRGFYEVSGGQFRQHRYKGFNLKSFPICIGVPPVTRHKRRSGFSMFDTENARLQTIRCW